MGESNGFDSIRTSRFPRFFGRGRRKEAAPTQKQYCYIQGQTVWTLLSFFLTGSTNRIRTGSNRTVLI
jgi:hypothetical protein